MLVNLYTDSKKMETYNRVHLIALIILSIEFFYRAGLISDYFIVILTALVVGIMAENTPHLKIAPGDTKMLVTSSIFLAITTNLKMIFIPIFTLILMKLVIVVIFNVTLGSFVILYNRYMRANKSSEYKLNIGQYKIFISFEERKILPYIHTSIPATGVILLSVITLYLNF